MRQQASQPCCGGSPLSSSTQGCIESAYVDSSVKHLSPGALGFSGVMDNTDVSFKLAQADASRALKPKKPAPGDCGAGACLLALADAVGRGLRGRDHRHHKRHVEFRLKPKR